MILAPPSGRRPGAAAPPPPLPPRYATAWTTHALPHDPPIPTIINIKHTYSQTTTTQTHPPQESRLDIIYRRQFKTQKLLSQKYPPPQTYTQESRYSPTSS